MRSKGPSLAVEPVSMDVVDRAPVPVVSQPPAGKPNQAGPGGDQLAVVWYPLAEPVVSCWVQGVKPLTHFQNVCFLKQLLSQRKIGAVT